MYLTNPWKDIVSSFALLGLSGEAYSTASSILLYTFRVLFVGDSSMSSFWISSWSYRLVRCSSRTILLKISVIVATSIFSFYENSRNYLNASKFKNFVAEDFVTLSNIKCNSDLSKSLSMISRNYEVVSGIVNPLCPEMIFEYYE